MRDRKEYVAPKLVVYGRVQRLTETDWVKPGGLGDTMNIENPENVPLSPNWHYQG